MAHANTMFQKTEAKPEFTDYTIASTKIGEVNKELSRIAYKIDRQLIANRRAFNLDTKLEPNPIKVRAGYPTKRFVDPERIKKRGIPNSNFLKQFKMVYKVIKDVTCQHGTDIRCKIQVLHATRGWKNFA